MTAATVAAVLGDARREGRGVALPVPAARRTFSGAPGRS